MSDKCSSKKSGCASGGCGPKNGDSQTKGVCFETSDLDVRFASNLVERALQAMQNGETKLEKLLLESAIELLEKTPDSEKGETRALVYTNYSDLLFRLRQYKQARNVAKKAVAFSRAAFSTTGHSYTALALANQADAVSRMGAQFEDEACALYQEAVQEIMSISEFPTQQIFELCGQIMESGAELFFTFKRKQEAQEILEKCDQFKNSFEFVPFRKAGFYKKVDAT